METRLIAYIKKLFRGSLILEIFLSQSCIPSKSVVNYFSRDTNAVDGSRKSFVDLIDGTRVNGDKVDIGGNFKTVIIVDKVKYELDKMKGLQMKNFYYTNFNGDLYETIVAGEKISVYKKGYATFISVNPLIEKI